MVNIDKKFVCVNPKIAIEFVTKELAMEINTAGNISLQKFIPHRFFVAFSCGK